MHEKTGQYQALNMHSVNAYAIVVVVIITDTLTAILSDSWVSESIEKTLHLCKRFLQKSTYCPIVGPGMWPQR